MPSFRLLLVLALSSALGAAAVAQQLPFTHYTTTREINPLPGASVTRTHQDSAGYLWIAVYGQALLCYDGHSFETYDSQDGLLSLQIWRIMEDRTGHLWITAWGGVVVSETPVTAVRDGRRLRFTRRIGDTELPQEEGRNSQLALDGRGRICMTSSTREMYRYEWQADGSLVREVLPLPLPDSDRVSQQMMIVGRQDGSIWISLDEGSLLHLPPDAADFQIVDTLTVRNRTPNTPFTTALHEGPTGVLWGGRRDGRIWRLQKQAIRPVLQLLDVGVSSTINDILETADGSLWLATAGEGLVEADAAAGTRRTAYTRRHGLLDGHIWDILPDHEGSLWISQNSGLSKLPPDFRAFGFITGESLEGLPAVLPESSVTSVLAQYSLPGEGDASRLLLVGTPGGIAAIGPGGNSEFIRSEQGLLNNTVLNLATDHRNRIWVCTSNGLNCIDFGSPVTMPAGASSVRPLALMGRPGRMGAFPIGQVNFTVSLSVPRRGGTASREDMLWTASPYGLMCFTGTRWLTFGKSAGVADRFWMVTGDDRGMIYAGSTNSGLYRSRFPLTAEFLAECRTVPVQVAGFEDFFKVEEPVFEPVVLEYAGQAVREVAVVHWLNGKLWTGTQLGMMVLDGENLQLETLFSTESHGLKAHNFTSLTVSPLNGHVWGGTRHGLVAMDPVGRTVVRTVGRQDGLASETCWGTGALSVAPDGTLYYGTPEGLVIYRPAHDRSNDTAPPLVFRAITFTEDSRGNNELFLCYAGLSFADERQVRYKTRLTGYDHEWSPATRENKIRYTNLPAFLWPRTYTFEVLAVNNDGVWAGTPLTHTVHVSPAWWLTWWSFVLYGLAFGLTLYGIRHYELQKQHRTAEIERRQRELEEARRLQLSMLPQELPKIPNLKIAVYMKTATEVGGDYYDFGLTNDGTLLVAIGDATGHGLQSGTLVSMMKALFTSDAPQLDIKTFMNKSSAAIKKIRLGRMLMALTLLHLKDDELQISTAGMPPVFIRRRQSG
ncbi:MAG: SpoIIE family protein phosphatase, partial [Acidobacteria bacterium]|nr:SpoIIE family protein phosphatase [Acidobacteriota bacterium]